MCDSPYLLQHVAAFVISREYCGLLGLTGHPVVADRAVIHLKPVPKFIWVGGGEEGRKPQVLEGKRLLGNLWKVLQAALF